jgi:hypothetical protein
MWKPALFLFTVVLVTPAGRDVLGQYASNASSMFAADSTYGDLAIAAMGLVLFCLFLLMFCQSHKDPNQMWILRRVRTQDPDVCSHRTR